MVWRRQQYGPELGAPRSWIEALSDAEIAEVQRATQGTIERLEDPRQERVSPCKPDFPLRTLAPRLEHIPVVASGQGMGSRCQLRQAGQTRSARW